MQLKAEIDIKEYKRALLKIAYELSYMWLGETYLDDPVAKKIRNCIMERSPEINWETEYPLKCAINIGVNHPIFSPWVNQENSHVGFIYPSNVYGLVCGIRIFDLFEAVIQISSEVAKYPHFAGNLVVIDAVRNSR
jgi:hypothetical protein